MFTGIHIFSDFIRHFVTLSPVFNDRTFLAIITVCIVIVKGDIPVIIHSSEIDTFCIVEATVHSLVSVMPFTGMERIISCLLQGFPDQYMIVGNSRSLFFQGIQIFPCHQHSTARHTDGTGSSPHDMGIGKDRTFGSQFIQIRGMYIFYTQEIHGRATHIVSQYQDNVRIFVCGQQTRYRQHSCT